MTNHYHALVWIDHQAAKVFRFDAESNETALIRSTHPRQHLHHKANSGDSGHAPVDKDFLERVATAVPAKISAVETVDHPTNGQLLAHARHFFRADDRMRSQIHS